MCMCAVCVPHQPIIMCNNFLSRTYLLLSIHQCTILYSVASTSIPSLPFNVNNFILFYFFLPGAVVIRTIFTACWVSLLGGAHFSRGKRRQLSAYRRWRWRHMTQHTPAHIAIRMWVHCKKRYILKTTHRCVAYEFMNSKINFIKWPGYSRDGGRLSSTGSMSLYFICDKIIFIFIRFYLHSFMLSHTHTRFVDIDSFRLFPVSICHWHSIAFMETKWNE